MAGMVVHHVNNGNTTCCRCLIVGHDGAPIDVLSLSTPVARLIRESTREVVFQQPLVIGTNLFTSPQTDGWDVERNPPGYNFKWMINGAYLIGENEIYQVVMNSTISGYNVSSKLARIRVRSLWE